MKAIQKYSLIASLMLLIPAMNGCDENDEINLNVTPVTDLYEPADNKSLELSSEASASLYFEWAHAKAEDGGMVMYELVFDQANGDFSDPVYRMPSDNNGSRNSATVTHKQLNKIAAMMGFGASEIGSFNWTVVSSKGVNEMKGDAIRTLTVKRLAGFADIPLGVYITGTATEGEATIAMKGVESGVFEIYTKLEAGKTYSFTDGDSHNYYPDGGVIKEGDTGASVDHTGIYRMTLDFTTGSFTTDEVTRVDMHILWKNELVELPYIGNGEWGTLADFSDRTDIDDDERYKFKVTTTALGRKDWVSVETHDNAPSGQDVWWYVKPDPDNDDDQWDDGHVWKLTSRGWNGKKLDVKFMLNPAGEYTHSIVQK